MTIKKTGKNNQEYILSFKWGMQCHFVCLYLFNAEKILGQK